MNTRIQDLMVESVLSTGPSRTVGHVRELMYKHRISCLPVLAENGEPVGIVTASDILQQPAQGRPVSEIMSTKVFTVPPYANPSLAARIMRNHHLHHIVVMHERKLVGILSSFDLLRLVENRRFVMKNAPTESKRHAGSRKKKERSRASPSRGLSRPL